MRRPALASIAACALLCACQNGTVTLSVTDAPIDGANLAKVRFTGIDLVENDGSTHSLDLNPDVSVNLLATSPTQLLGSITVPEGDYKQIVLHVSADGSGTDSFVTYPTSAPVHAGQTLALQIPDADVDGITIPATFNVKRLHNTALTADINLRRSILEPDVSGDPFVLDLIGGTADTNVRVVNNEDVGTLTGSVAASTVASGSSCSPAAIYVYQGSSVTPDDEGGSGAQPFSSTTVPSGGTGSGFVSYTVGFLPPGPYTIALVCNPVDDDPVADDNLDAPVQQNVTIEAGVTTTAAVFQ